MSGTGGPFAVDGSFAFGFYAIVLCWSALECKIFEEESSPGKKVPAEKKF